MQTIDTLIDRIASLEQRLEEMECNCLFSHPDNFVSGGLAMLKSEVPSFCAVIVRFKMFVNVTSTMRRDREAKTEMIVARRNAPLSLLLVLPDFRTCASRRKSRSL